MIIRAVHLVDFPSIYPRGKGGPLPDHLAWLHPDAVGGLERARHSVVLSGCYRSPARTAEARATKQGVQKPGRSAHNFAMAVDIDVRQTLKRLSEHDGKARDKRYLDDWLNSLGFTCYRPFGSRGREEWHYTFGASGPGSIAVEAAIQRQYGAVLKLSKKQVQEALTTLRLYDGPIDGDHGPLTRRGLDLFRRQWKLPPDDPKGSAGAETQRLLAVVTAAIGQPVPVTTVISPSTGPQPA